METNFRQRISRLCIRLLFVAVVAAAPTYALSQVKITISDQIVSVKGEKMYVHNVKKGETIYSICKAYNITADDLQRYNPVIASGLKEGQILYIPVSGLQNSVSEPDSPQPQNTEYDPESFINHKVRWLENLDDIAEKYGVDKKDIMAFNNMKSESLRKIKRLKIPVKKAEPPYTTQPVDSLFTDNNPQIQTDTPDNPDILPDDTDYPKVYSMPDIDASKARTIALLLPMNSNGKANANYMDFYSGALMAIEQIKRDGGSIKLNVLDYGEDISSVAFSEKISEADLIIGPIRYQALKEIVPMANSLRIPIVSPLDAAADSLLGECPYLFQAALSTQRQVEALADMIIDEASKAPNPNIIIVYSTSSADASKAEMLKQVLEEKGASVTASGSSGVLSAVRRDMDNIIVVQTYTEGLTAEILRQIDIKMIPPEKVTLFGTPKWKNFEALDMSLYFKYNTRICMPHNIDLNRQDVRQFIRAYRSLYNCEPKAYAFNGYDIVYFFCKAVLGGMRECSEEPDNTIASDYMQKNLLQLDMLQQKFRFVRNPEGGWVNTAATKIYFNPDYSITQEQN
ncbi:MAG: LysM peptidoglycan-binding domain-containing protein [Bacteroidales bacterium]|nr:LysM peptidoglycan-binding domain-containing protein [Bacteroidales bacterium]